MLAPRFLAALVVVFAWLAACGDTPAPKSVDAVVAGQGRSLPIAAAADNASESDLAVPISADDPVRGSRPAFVTIVVFSDFQCPFCSRHATTLERIAETYGEDVRIVFKHDPLSFHPHAALAAEVGSAVFALQGPEAFWRYHDMAFRRQQLMAPDSIRAWSIAAGADSRDVEAGLESKKWAAKVERDVALAKRLGVNGTPASFVNGVLLTGAQPFEKFKEVIDAALIDAKALAERGVPRERIYGRLVTASFKDPKRPAAEDDDGEDQKRRDAEVWKVPVASSPVLGSSSALVTIVEFSDFQCPFCKRVQPVLDRVRTTYGDRVRIVWKDAPLSFHPRAVPAAELARFARAAKGEAAFWAMHDLLFDAQPRLDDPELEALARHAGLDVTKAMAAVHGKASAKLIDADLMLMDDVSASGTPHFFVNGKRLVGAQPFEKLKAVIDAELANAESLVKSGVARSAVYETIIKDGKTDGGKEPERKVVAAGPATSPFRGAANAKVVIQEFSDFQCPFCSRVEPTIDQLLKDYPGKVKVVWRNMPLSFHADAPLAAEAAREAFVQKGNEGFSKMRELLFKHQSDQDGLKRTQLEAYASQIGLDLKKFGKALDDGTHKAAIEADRKAADDAGISGTPAFTVGPYFLSGAQPAVKFKRLVERVFADKP